MILSGFLWIVVMLVTIEVGYQVVNLVVKKMNNIPIPNSAETEEE